MNIFRSEEHVQKWSYYEAASADGIMPLADWAQAFGGPLFRNRLEPDYLSHLAEYAGAFRQTLTDLGKTGPFWRPSA